MEAMQRHFAQILEDIRSGGFARRFQDEQANGYPTLAAIQSITSGQDPMTHAEERVREALDRDPSD
jgi:ketol-acid reductoisomerase